jgi:hypothetical protein
MSKTLGSIFAIMEVYMEEAIDIADELLKDKH